MHLRKFSAEFSTETTRSVQVLLQTWLKGQGGVAGRAGLHPERFPPGRILDEALIAAMAEVGARFERQEFQVPEMLVAARAMQGGLGILQPQLVASGLRTAGKVLVGTVKGDLHDIGKNLVAMMLGGAGYEVVDLGPMSRPRSSPRQ